MDKLRGTTQNLAAAVGTALAGALLVGLLSTIALNRITTNPILTKDLQSQVNLDNITFISNDRLRTTLEGHHRHAAAGGRSGADQHRSAGCAR